MEPLLCAVNPYLGFKLPIEKFIVSVSDLQQKCINSVTNLEIMQIKYILDPCVRFNAERPFVQINPKFAIRPGKQKPFKQIYCISDYICSKSSISDIHMYSIRIQERKIYFIIRKGRNRGAFQMHPEYRRRDL